MKRLLVALFFIASFQLSYSQDFAGAAFAEIKDSELYPSILSYNDYAELLPRPVGGLKKMIEKIDYPLPAKFSKTEGTVILLAYINEYGEVKAVEIVKNIGFGCGEAAAKAIAKSKFIPAVHNGKNVSVKTAIPVKFQLYRSSF